MHVSGTQSQPTSRLVVPPVLAIGKGFRGFGKGGPDGIKEEPLVQPYAPSDFAKLLDKRKMLKELVKRDPQQVFDMMDIIPSIPLFKVLALARKQQKLMVPHSVHNEVLRRTDYYVRTGTIVIYKAPNQPFGEVVSFDGFTFTVPETFRGLKNCALAVEYPDFDVTPDGKLVVPDESTIHLIQNFPNTSSTWHMVHAATGIPHGRAVKKTNENARSLFRLNHSYVGILVRGIDVVGYGRNVYANGRYDDNPFGVALI